MNQDIQAELNDALEAIVALRRFGAGATVRVHSITNTVSQEFTADVLLACGARASMTANPEEAGEFVERADVLHINLGTMDKPREQAIAIAWARARELEKPIVLDPAMAHLSAYRTRLAQRLIAEAPSITRMNVAEWEGLHPPGPEGNSCLAITGGTDRILAKGREIKIANGHPLMAQVIATGCAQGALFAALAVHARTKLAATLAGVIWFAVAAEIAAGRCFGPGSFKPAFLDALHEVSIGELKGRANIR